MPIRAVIFDFNGVLVDDEHVHFQLFRELLSDEQITLDEKTYHDRYLGYDDRGCFTAALIDNGYEATCSYVNALITRKASRYAQIAETELKFFPAAAESVSLLARKHPIAICSGALRSEIEYALNRLQIRDHVESITSAEDTERCKPDPEGYLHALAKLRANHPDLLASECLVIEDSLAGIQAAKFAGMVPVGVSHTYSNDLIKEYGAIAVIDRLDQITSDWVDALPS